ncbi:oligosaccharide flippase family protein [Rhodococcus ruber]|uniref:oligosaccharide flippase family protein n=1 Tax=Rhodococcus ruber TaxID=1830 RepID=UPI003D815C75
MRMQFVSVLGARMAGSALSALGLILLARSVSVSDFGIVSIAIAIGTMLSVVSDFGTQNFLSVNFATSRFDLVRSGIRIGSISVVIWSALCLVGCSLIFGWNSFSWSISAVLIALLFEKNVESLLAVSVARGDRVFPALSILTRRVAAILCFIGATALGCDGVASYALGAVFSVFLAQWQVMSVRLRIPGWRRFADTSDVLKECSPFFINSTFAQVRVLDVVIVGSIASVESAALYGAASRLTSPLVLFGSALSVVVLPYAARATEASIGRFVRLVVLSSIIVSALFVLTFPFGDALMSIVYGEDFEGGGDVLSALLVGYPVFIAGSILLAVLQGRGKERFAASNSIAFAVVLAVVVTSGATMGGGEGAAIGVGLVAFVRLGVLGASLAATRAERPSVL